MILQSELDNLKALFPQHLPGPTPYPFAPSDYPPYQPPRGRWVWIPDDAPNYIPAPAWDGRITFVGSAFRAP